MKKNVCKCGNDEFEANQLCRINVIVDSENFFIRNARKTMDDSCYDSEKPSGDYICTKCNAEYESLNQLPKTKYYTELLIDKKINGSMQELLDLDDEEYTKYINENKIDEDSTIFSKTITFENGYQVNIKVCTGQSNAYVDCVLFDDKGNEISCCVGETLLGKICFECDNLIFEIDVKLSTLRELFIR